MGRFSPTLMDHFESPRNLGRLEAPDLAGEATLNGRAPAIQVELQLQGHFIQQARFRASGCGVAIAAGSALTELVVGRSIDQCRQLGANDIDLALDGLPADKWFCAVVAISALQNALGVCPEPPPGQKPT